MRPVVVAILLALPGFAQAQIGRVDAVGGTTCDWQTGGPAYRMLVNSAGHGIHVLWMYSASERSTYPDRDMRYNFYDYAAREWRWLDPDSFMQSGINVFTERTGFGNLAADPFSGVAFVSAHLGSPLRPRLARDVSPGAGVFEYCDGRPNAEAYGWPYFAVDAAGTAHFALINDWGVRDILFYSKVDPWCEFSVPVPIAPPRPDPYFPCHNIAASRVSRKVTIAWEFSAGNPDPGFYRTSTDGGVSWQDPQELVPPAAYGGDTLTSYHISSMFPFYDAGDNLHMVVSLMPYVGSQGFILPAQLWHWSPGNNPNWHRIHIATTDTVAAPVGYNALFACRVSIGSDPDGNLFVTWEQFDSLNVEPVNNVLRADIYYSHSGDNGRTWAEPVRITTPCSVSHRFPIVMDHITDSVAVSYLIDEVAGFHAQGQGPATLNPVVVQRWPNPYVGVKEQGQPPVLSPRHAATIIRGSLSLPRDIGAGHNPILPGESGLCPKPVLLDISGRKVMDLQPGENDVRHLAPGVYFIRAKGSMVQGTEGSSQKVIIQR